MMYVYTNNNAKSYKKIHFSPCLVVHQVKVVVYCCTKEQTPLPFYLNYYFQLEHKKPTLS